MRSSVTDIASGLFSLLVAAVFCSQIADLEGVSRMYPVLLLGFITLGGLYLLAQGLFKRRRGCDAASDDDPVAFGRVGMISATSMAYVLIIPILGFYSASILFLFGSSLVLNDTGSGKAKAAMAACLLTAIMCLAVWSGFTLLLDVPTPEGMLF